MTKSLPAEWVVAKKRIDELIASLKTKSFAELGELAANPVDEPLCIGKKTILLRAWALAHGAENIGVVVEGRRKMFGGLWDRVTARGFFVTADGATTEMEEKDLWDQGY